MKKKLTVLLLAAALLMQMNMQAIAAEIEEPLPEPEQTVSELAADAEWEPEDETFPEQEMLAEEPELPPEEETEESEPLPEEDPSAEEEPSEPAELEEDEEFPGPEEETTADEEPEEEQEQSRYSLHIPSGIPVVFGSTECWMEAVSIAESGGFCPGTGVLVTLTFDGVFSSADTGSTLPYTICAVYADGSCREIPSGSVLLFACTEDGALEEYGTLDGSPVTGFLLLFPEGAWEHLEPGDYSTSIAFSDELFGAEETETDV